MPPGTPTPVDRAGSLLPRLDRLAGIPLVAAAGAARMMLGRRPLPARPARIGLLKTAAIGDTVLMSALARDLAAAHPDASLTVFAGSDNASVAALIPGVDGVVPLRVARPWDAVRAIRAHRLDLLVDCGAWPRIDALLAACGGAACTAGFRTPGQHRHAAYDVVVDHRADRHELANYRALGSAVGAAAGHAPELAVPESTLARSLPVPYAVCHVWPGGRNPAFRRWDEERWMTVFTGLRADGLTVVLTGAPTDQGITDAMVRRWVVAGGDAAGVRSVAGVATMRDLPAVLSGAAVVVSVNTGVMHMAAVLGAPTVALNGPTAAHRWGPVGPRVASVNSDLPECGYLNLGWEYAGRRPDCMDGVRVDAVLESVRRMRRTAEAGRR